MARVAQKGPPLKLSPEGTLRELPLPRLLGYLGLLSATGVVEIQENKLLRRLVVDDGLIQVLISNARDDRFIDWFLASGHASESASSSASEVLEAVGESPLSAQAALRFELTDEVTLIALMRAHLLELLGETATRPRADYRIQPGRLSLGEEPVARLPAVEAGLVLARQAADAAKRAPNLPPGVVARLTPEDAASTAGLVEADREVLAAARKPVSISEILATQGSRAQSSLVVLFAVGLLAPAEPPRVAAESRATAPERELTAAELERWIAAAEAEDLPAILGVGPAAQADEVRSAYYRTVRRFHPDRFRDGPLSGYHGKVESCFRLVHDALQVLTDPAARRRWDKRNERPQGADPRKLAKQRLAQARKLAAQGRRGDAVAMLETGLRSAPDDPDLRLHLALLLAGNPRRRQESIETLSALASEQLTRADIASALVLALHKAGRDVECQTAASRLRALSVSDPALRIIEGDEAAAAKLREDPFRGPLV